MSDAPTDEVKLNGLMFQVLDHAVESIKDSHGPLIPFSIVEEVNGERKMAHYVTERLEEGEARAKKSVAEMKSRIVRYALAWDGYLTIKGEKWDALFVEAGDKVGATGILLGQRYQKKRGLFSKKTEPVGNPGLLEKPPSLIK